MNYDSHIFDYVEIDSSFYRIPTIFMVQKWYRRTPEGFRFAAKRFSGNTYCTYDGESFINNNSISSPTKESGMHATKNKELIRHEFYFILKG
jgi:uncharacterized protein YecE (DUF72 family)